MKLFASIFLLIYYISIFYICTLIFLSNAAITQYHSIRHITSKREVKAPVNDDRQLNFRFLRQPESQIAKSNDTLMLNCEFSVDKKDKIDTKIEWRKDGLIVNSLRSTGRILVLANNSLLIEGAILEDEGSYQCVVHITDEQSSLWSFISKKGNVFLVPTIIKFISQPKSQAVFEGNSVAFECQLRPSEISFHPSVSWYYNEKAIEMTNNDYQVVPETNTLEIQSVKKNHLGSYYCIIHYDGFEKKSEVGILTLKDHSQNKEDNKLSMSVSPPSEIDVILGDRFVLPCLSLKPSATITKWINGTNSNEKNIMLPNNRIKQVGHGSLMVEKAELSDNGLYTCHVSNTNDFEEKSTRVNVRMKPIIIKSLDDEIALETKDIEIHCDAESFPKSKITWYKNGEPIIPSEYFVINYNYLKILGLVKDDQGVYQCVIENDVGSVESHAQIMINTPDILLPYYKMYSNDDFETSEIDQMPSVTNSIEINNDNASLLALAGSSGHPKKPGKPTGLKSLNTGSRFVELIWDLPSGNNQDIVRYHIMYKEIGQNRERTLNTSLTTIVINGLSAETNYVFTVSAENYAGIGEASKPLKITTEKEDSVPGKVRNLFAKASDSESIDVSWEPPLIGGGSTNVSHYNLFYSKKSEDRETRIPMIKTFHTLHGLARNTEYRIRVETEGKNGVGKSSDVLFIKTLSDVPSGRPFNIRVTERFPDSISLSWSGPREDERNGEITGYNIKYKAKKKGSKLKIAHVKGDVQKFQLSRLEGGTQYSIRIAAVNSNGTGPYSEAISAETSFEDKVENQPVGPPIELRVVPSFDRIRVSWKPPIDDSAIIRGYTIGWGINVPDVESAQVDGNIREFTIKNLKPNKEYVVSARAYNNFGAGFPIYETIRTTSYSNSEFNGFGRKSQKNRGSDETYYDDEDESFDSEQKFRKSDESGVPTYVTSETLSATSIKVAWSEENINVFNPEYSVKYFSRSDVNGEVKYVKSNENEVEIEGLRPNTVYEFSVRLVGSTKWSSPSSNKTMSAPPSSAPQDLTIIPPSQDHRGGEPNSVTLNWQPPKYENGEILEYLIYYSEKEDLPDKDWLRDSVKGDKLGLRIFNLKPFTTYYFKVQARNVKGYGPLSRPVSYSINSSHYKDLGSVFGNQDSSLLSPEIMAVIKANFLLIIIGVIVIVVLLLLIILCTIICSNKKSDQKSIPNQNGTLYSTVNNRRQGLVDKDNRDGVSDLWINSSLNHTGREVYCDTPEVTLIESSRMGKNSTESPPPLYQTLHDKKNDLNSNIFSLRPNVDARRISTSSDISVSADIYKNRTPPILPVRMTESLHESNNKDLSSTTPYSRPVMVPSLATIRSLKLTSFTNQVSEITSGDTPSTTATILTNSENGDCGTLQRSYHHSSTSLEVGNQRQRTPQIVYTGTNRQPIAKIDFTSTTTASDMGSNFSGSTTALPIHTPPPQGDVTYAGSNASKRSCGNLRSFTHISNIGLSYVNNQQAKTAHIVRPLPTSNSPVAASTPVVPNNGSPSIIKAYSSSSHSSVPVGRAPAQPRINMANIYTPISPVKSSHGDLLGLGGSGGGIETDSRYSDTTLGLNNSSNYNHLNGLQASNSFEEINSEMESLNTMILDIRALHHEFNESM
uniref:Netrin receptor DCC (inferred by orthology to a human protein) n=1 Tax=Strongyloides venezuelensis TaxID=75913 RepID=A0A0K0FGC5_STRVS